jgi:hypothetical protein
MPMARLRLDACRRHVLDQWRVLSLLHAEWHVLDWLHAEWHVLRWMHTGGMSEAIPDKDEPASDDRVALRLVASREDKGISQLVGEAKA